MGENMGIINTAMSLPKGSLNYTKIYWDYN